MKVTIHFYRHGESEANVTQHQMKCGDVRHLLMRDPVLTKAGVDKSVESQNDAPEVDIILSSQLLRAIQTALYTYPKKFVHVVPFLNELGCGLDNSPLDNIHQKNILKNDFYRVEYTNNHNEKNFIEYLKVHILPRFSNKNNINVAMFTHSRLMRKYLNKSMDDLPNNVRITKEFDL